VKKNLIEEIAKEYDISQDFDIVNTKFATDLILPFCNDRMVLEVGCATGEMTKELAKVCRKLVVVEPSVKYCQNLASYDLDIDIHNCFFEELESKDQYDIVILASLLHHIEVPGNFLQLVKEKLKDEGFILATVPNMNSLHRRVGVKAKLLENTRASTERNIRFGQYGRFTKESFKELFNQSGFKIYECFGYMLKPFSSGQMQGLNLPRNIYQALFELGKEFEELSSQLFIRASKKAA